MFSEWLEVHDDCTFTIDGDNYIAVIKKINKDSLEVRPISVNYLTPEKYEMLTLPSTSYDNIKLQIWDDGRGCDNSAIGIAGCYDSYQYWLTDLGAAMAAGEA